MSCFGPCHFKLKEALDRAERKSEFILTTQLGSGYIDGAFCNMIAESAARIGAKEYTAHGLRKNAAPCRGRLTVHQIMAITETWRRAMHYTQRAAQKHLAQQAIDKLESATKVANHGTISVQKTG